MEKRKQAKPQSKTRRRATRARRQTRSFPIPIPLLIITSVFLLGGLLIYTASQPVDPSQIKVNGASMSETHLTQGKQVYLEQCAACHGEVGEGQPNWRYPNAEGVLPAPPHDNTGHTWHHADRILLQMIADGGSTINSAMPGYEDILTDEEMVNVLAYIKTFWGQRELEAQQALN